MLHTLQSPYSRIFEYLKYKYYTSEVVSGEFILSVTIPLEMGDHSTVKRAVDMFLEWDESSLKFEVQESNIGWKILEKPKDTIVENMSDELPKGKEITISIPFTYTIGDKGAATGKELLNIEDCLNEATAELNLYGANDLEFKVD